MANEEAVSQFDWHRKPTGWTGAPCPICGCSAKRLKAAHRALAAEETWQTRPLALWVKRLSVIPNDTVEVLIPATIAEAA